MQYMVHCHEKQDFKTKSVLFDGGAKVGGEAFVEIFKGQWD